MTQILINRTYKYSFVAGGMVLELKGTCTADELKDAQAVLEIAIRQIQREIELSEISGKLVKSLEVNELALAGSK